MARIPHGAKVLASQVREALGRKADSKVGLGTMTPVGDPDGLGVYRKFKFDKTASKWLLPVLDVMDDSRIAGYEEVDGKVVVEFSPKGVADQRDPYPLDEARLVAGE